LLHRRREAGRIRRSVNMQTVVLTHLAGDLWAALRRAGVGNTLRILASSYRDRDFDRTYGTDTAGHADPRLYAGDDPRARRATFYAATRARPFLQFLACARLPRDGTFVDYGCGKGRAMLLAAQYGFAAVTGIELSPRLCAVAERNIELFRPLVPQSRFEVIRGDAGEYAVRDADVAFYFYDPFDDALIEQCLGQIADSLARRPRRVAILYHNSIAVRPTVFDRQALLAEEPMPRFAGNAFFLYRNRANV
jgi:SAM-dependent methyltransferase